MDDLRDTLETAEEEQTASELRRRLRTAEAEVRRLQDETVDAAAIRKLMGAALSYQPEPPEWLGAHKRKEWRHGVPLLAIADLHWGERVDPAQINHVNEYSLETAQTRLCRVFERSAMLLADILGSSYPGVVVGLLGDILTGYIHEEIRENADVRLLPACFDVADHLSAGIDLLAGEFGRVFVSGVVGNHGRLDAKPRSKFGVVDNVDWLVYTLLQRKYRGDDRVTIQVPDTFDAAFRIYGTRILLTHGNQFRGGSGISGPATPWALGDHRKRKVRDAMRMAYDTMVFGHWHSSATGIADSYFAVGTLKGYDEYAMNRNLPFERPSQGLYVVHPEHGFTFRMKVYGDEVEQPRATDWVSITEKQGRERT